MTEKLLSLLKNLYVKKYKLLLFIPIILLILAMAQIIGQYAVTGDFINRGISLKGGVTVTIPEHTTDIIELEKNLEQTFPDGDILIRRLTQKKGIVIDASDVIPEQLVEQTRAMCIWSVSGRTWEVLPDCAKRYELLLGVHRRATGLAVFFALSPIMYRSTIEWRLWVQSGSSGQ